MHSRTTSSSSMYTRSMGAPNNSKRSRLAVLAVLLTLLLVWYATMRSSPRSPSGGELAGQLDQAHATARKQAELAVGDLLQQHGAEVGLRADLGSITWRVNTEGGEARTQRYMDQGFRLLVAFDMKRAHQSFAQAARLDARCAMCAWGEALSLGQTLNAAQDPAVEGRAYLDALHGLAVARTTASSSLFLIPRENRLIAAEDSLRSRVGSQSVDTIIPELEQQLLEALLLRYNCPQNLTESVPDSVRHLSDTLTTGLNGEEVRFVEETWSQCVAAGLLSREELNKRYAAAMEALALRFEAHDHVLFLAADAFMNLSPWDYWLDGHQSERIRPSAQRARDFLEKVIARSPDHAGALHLFIHLTEAGPHPEDALEAAKRLGNLLPGSPHLRHMPSHTFIRTGMYQESAHSNERALELPLVQHVYPQHNMDFLVYSLRMLGKSEQAWTAATMLGQYSEALLAQYGHPRRTPLEATFPAERFAVAPLQCAALFRRADWILAQPEPPAPRFYQRAIYHWARGLARLQAVSAATDAQGKRAAVEQAQGELARLREALAALLAEPDSAQYYGGAYPAVDLMRIAELELAAELARFSDATPGQSQSESELLKRALAIETALPYDEPPSQHFSVAHRLGAALSREGQLAAAERCYRDSLAYFHNDGWALFGLWQVQRAAKQKTDQVEELFRRAWSDADVQLVDSATVRV
mmetsp:Transcript_13302/g.40161  ORF Transcript_13302/g.40161 Transcript_13302/m.40161 type:complete len:700 (-) Transcript_13302:176-2275(-)